MKHHLPNTITIARIVVTPAVLALMFTESFWGRTTAFVLFVLAAISDYVDGRLARHYQVHSRLGQFLDPLADKVLVLGAFIVLAIRLPELVPWWAVGVIAFRDLFLTGLRLWAEANGRSLRTLGVAKIKTTFQLTFLIGILLVYALVTLPGLIGEIAGLVLTSPFTFYFLVITVGFTFYTGVVYLFNMEYATPSDAHG